ncbi:thiolase family protein [Tatumella citrea]|uniref:Acetyl-CoA acetyltransferase n=1 Tax=Tatumella citrea TaxID=53336 RepID=A0A1Y0LIX2_TATCI|nr:thiolase family protein [Tatumella citrea]ARU93994.1 acetyl-CoA acetyltransferase [Tatumella citrea]ARU98032.1 acetyl-CoA acetyltransferase [Tatumella citrea]
MSAIIAALRTAVVPRGGAFNELLPHQLAELVIRALLSQTGIAAAEVSQLVMANSLGAGGNPARVAALAAGLDHVSGLSIDTQCAGGLDAVALAAALVDAGTAEIVIAGGAESYSRRPLRAKTFADQRPAEFYTRPSFTPDPEADPDMTMAAGELADRFHLTRQEQDQFAIDSHHKALAAASRLTAEIVPLAGVTGDVYPRALSLRLAQRTPALAGTVSLASTAVEADGAAFCVVVSDKTAARLGCGFALTVAGYQTLGADTRLPGYAPVEAIRRLFERNPQYQPQHCLTEMMEAYAAQAMVCIRQSGLAMDNVNVGGGALARGHPIGASGAVLLCRMFHELRQRNGQTGLCAIAAAGGLGSAMLLSPWGTQG